MADGERLHIHIGRDVVRLCRLRISSQSTRLETPGTLAVMTAWLRAAHVGIKHGGIGDVHAAQAHLGVDERGIVRTPRGWLWLCA